MVMGSTRAVYEGEYKHGSRCGQGAYRYPSGDVYIGGWFDGKQHGYGEYTYADGAAYHGLYSFNQRNGRGEYIGANKNTIFRGEWVDNKPILDTNDPLLPSSDQMTRFYVDIDTPL